MIISVADKTSPPNLNCEMHVEVLVSALAFVF